MRSGRREAERGGQGRIGVGRSEGSGIFGGQYTSNHNLYLKCVMEELESVLYTLMHWESMILEDDGLQLSKIGGGQRKLKGGKPLIEFGGIGWKLEGTCRQ